MQYITLTLPCLDPGRQGPERGTHWVGSGQVQGSRSPNLTVVCKRELLQGLHFVCISNYINHEMARNLRNPKRHFKWSEMIISHFKNNDHFSVATLLKTMCISVTEGMQARGKSPKFL